MAANGEGHHNGDGHHSTNGLNSESTNGHVLLATPCDQLQTESAAANEALRNFLVSHPAARQELTVLSRELADVQMVARMLSRNAAESTTVSLPPVLLAAIGALVRDALGLVAEITEVLTEPERADFRSGSGPGAGRQAWLEHVAERVGGTVRPAETTRRVLNLGLDALLFSASFRPQDNDADLPPYDSTQIMEEIFNLRVRLGQDADSDEPRIHLQRPIVTEFVDTLQQYIEQTSTSVAVPQTNVDGGSPSDAASMNPPPIATPAYNAIDITTPAPGQIDIRHLVKKDISDHEILEVVFFQRQSVPTIALCTLEAPTRFYSHVAVPVTALVSTHGVSMTFSPDGRSMACISEDDSRELNPVNHDGVHFRRRVVYVADHVKDRKTQQIRGRHVRPLAFSHDGRFLAVAGPWGRVALHDARPMPLSSLDRPAVFNCHGDAVTHAVFTPDRHALVTLSRDGTIRLTDPETLEPLGKLDTDTWKTPKFLGVTPDSDVIVSIWGDTVYHWNYNTGTLESYTLGSKRRRDGWPLAISQDCRFLACRNEDGADVSNLHTGRVLHSIRFQSGFATCASFSQDSKYLAFGKAATSVGVRVTKSTLDVWELIF